MIDAVVTRVAALVPDLRSVERMAAFAALLRDGQLPQQTPAAYVITQGLTASRPNAIGDLYQQTVKDGISVCVVFRDIDPAGADAADSADVIIRQIIEAVAGWSANNVGTFEFTRARLAAQQDGAFVYQIDFVITDQLRFTPA